MTAHRRSRTFLAATGALLVAGALTAAPALAAAGATPLTHLAAQPAAAGDEHPAEKRAQIGAGTVTVTTPSITQGTSPLVVNYTANPSGNYWIGIVPRGQAPTPSNYIGGNAWQNAPSTSGSVNLDTSGLAIGSYDVWLLARSTTNGAYDTVAGPAPLDVTAQTGTVSLPVMSVGQGTASLAVQYTANPATNNWVSITQPGKDPGSAYSTWAEAPLANGTSNVNISSLQPGTYNVYLMSRKTTNGVYNQLAGPVQLIVAQAGTISTPQQTILQGTASIPVTYTTNPPSNASNNWIGVFPDGVTPSAGNYQPGWQTASGPSGTVNLGTSTLTPGVYRIWYMSNNGYTAMAPDLVLNVVTSSINTVPVANPAVAGATMATGVLGVYLLRRRTRRTPTV
ncbi:hypothetical protein [Kitasatospora sp. LaBMicrA B282]|uniref:hypothetical protein n=1 Tax=Kitasatospora sp. LaBMicrA B282 TaxID=3420949 RepID=UPI003D0C04C1